MIQPVFINMYPVCLLSGDISCKTSSYKRDIHTYNYTLRTVHALFAKQEIVFFSKVYSIYRAHTLVGKEKQGGLWVTQLTCGQRNCVINFKEAPQGGFDGQNRKTPKQTRSFSNPNFNHCSGTMEKGAITETSWTTETLKGK